jgi:hypothetical protein
VTGVASGDLNFADPAGYRFVKKTGKDVHLCATSGELVYGVLNNKPKDNEHASVCVDGFTKICVGGSLGADVLVATNGSGFAISASSGQAVCGRLISGANSGMPAEMQFVFTGSGR